MWGWNGGGFIRCICLKIYIFSIIPSGNQIYKFDGASKSSQLVELSL
jgi:hypothetical protein